MKIINQNKNELFSREEIEIEMESLVSPSREEVYTKLSEEIKSSSKENTIIKSIKGRFGSRKFKITAYIYNTPEDKKSMEPKKKEKKA